MKASSFRFRVVAWSVLVSGAVLVAFGAVSWQSLKWDRMQAQRESLQNFGFRHVTRASAKADPARMETSLVENFGEEKAKTRFFAFRTREGRELFRTATWPEGLDSSDYPGGGDLLDPQPRFPTPAAEERRGRGDRPVMEPRFYLATDGERKYQIGVFANEEVVLVVGADTVELSDETHRVGRAFLLALPGALLLVALGSWLLARRALRPIDALSQDMAAISAHALDSRLDVGRADREFATIVERYNAMLERLERSFRQATRFSADASHELKTPLAVMRASLEQALAESNDAAQQAVYSELLEQTDRQKAILENLLLLSRADAGRLRISAETLPLGEKLALWLEDASFLAEGKEIDLTSEIEPDLFVSGDETLLQQVAHNLFSNAVRHNIRKGSVTCRLFSEGRRAVWEVENSGPTIDAEEADRLFERFHRGSTSDGDGTGLGLSLVREIVHAHGGIVRATVREGRNVFRVELPNITPP